MPKYAYFDPTSSAPHPVTGWYDTDNVRYDPPPAAANLLELTLAQWTARLGNLNGFAVNGGVLVSYP